VGASVTVTQQPQSVIPQILPTNVTFSVGATSTLAGLANTNLAYVWQRDGGAGFQDILGAYGSIYAVTIASADSGARFRCLVFSPGAAAISEAASVGGPRLGVSRDVAKIRLSWDLGLAQAGFELQQAPALPLGLWTTVPPGFYATNGSTVLFEVALPAAEPMRFYRLRSP
jgi:hypothetical protein